MGSPRDPKIDQNDQKACSRGLPESTLKKGTKNDAFWVPSRPQNIRFRAIGVSKIEKSPVAKNDLQITSKCLPFWMLLAPEFGKSAFQKGTRKYSKKCIQKVAKKEPTRDSSFRAKNHQNHKNPSLGPKMCPKPPGEAPRHPKYSKIIKK